MFANFTVFGLLRKPRNGTPFYIQTPGNPMKGWATVVARTKTPTGDEIRARLQVSGTEFSFHSKDKTAWPDAKPTPGVKVYRVKKPKMKMDKALVQFGQKALAAAMQRRAKSKKK